MEKWAKIQPQKLTSELQWAVAVPECLFSQGSLALRFTFQYDFYEECPAPAAVSWAHSLIQSSYSWGDIWEFCVFGGGYSCHTPRLLLQGPSGSIPGAVLGLHGEHEGLCTLNCWEGAPGAELFPSRNVLGRIPVILVQLFAFYPPEGWWS